MKLVTQFVDPVDAADANDRLRLAGVMTEIKPVDPHILRPSKSGALRIGLYVVFDDQFEDAVELLQNPDHVPQRVISPAEMQALQAPGAPGRPVPRYKPLDNFIALAVGLVLLGLVVYTVIGVFLEL